MPKEEFMTDEQHRALEQLQAAIKAVHNCGLWDQIQPYCKRCDSINDVIDSVDAFIEDQK